LQECIKQQQLPQRATAISLPTPSAHAAGFRARKGAATRTLAPQKVLVEQSPAPLRQRQAKRDIANEGPLGTARREMEADASEVLDNAHRS
jgi:hypothetical protein